MNDENSQPTEGGPLDGMVRALDSEHADASAFDAQKERTAEDIESVVAILQKQAAAVRAGDMKAFEQWWIEGGTEEGDASVFKVRELLMLRYFRREELRSNAQAQAPDTAPGCGQ